MATDNFPLCFTFCFNDDEESIVNKLKVIKSDKSFILLRGQNKRLCIIKCD